MVHLPSLSVVLRRPAPTGRRSLLENVANGEGDLRGAAARRLSELVVVVGVGRVGSVDDAVQVAYLARGLDLTAVPIDPPQKRRSRFQHATAQVGQQIAGDGGWPELVNVAFNKSVTHELFQMPAQQRRRWRIHKTAKLIEASGAMSKSANDPERKLSRNRSRFAVHCDYLEKKRYG